MCPSRKRANQPARDSFKRIETALESIRRRAYELFRSRGGTPENDLDDWFRAERELFEVPPGELAENDAAFVVSVATPGFEADQLEVAVEPESVTIRGATERKRESTREKQIYSELTRKELFRRVALPGSIDTTKVKATLTDGLLKVTLPKATNAQMPVAA